MRERAYVLYIVVLESIRIPSTAVRVCTDVRAAARPRVRRAVRTIDATPSVFADEYRLASHRSVVSLHMSQPSQPDWARLNGVVLQRPRGSAGDAVVPFLSLVPSSQDEFAKTLLVFVRNFA